MSSDGGKFLQDHFRKVQEIQESSLYDCLSNEQTSQSVLDSVVEAYFKFGDLVLFYRALLEYYNEYDEKEFLAKYAINTVFVDLCVVEGVSKLLNEITEHPEELAGIPELWVPDIARLAREGRNLVRQRRGSLVPDSALRAFVPVAPTFYISAILNDDLEAIDHLNTIPEMRAKFSADDIRKECNRVRDFSNKFSEFTHTYFLSLKINKVYDRFRKELPLTDYFNKISNAIKEEKGLDEHFDASLSLRFGPSMISSILEKHSKLAGDGQLKVRDMFLAKHIKAGVDAYSAYLESRFGRVKAMDFIDDPRDSQDIIDWCLGSRTREERGQDHSFFLAMLTPEELLKHERGQDCLRRVHELTRDVNVLKLITSLQYRGKAFGEDLSL
jgi:hypothetical protein